jgi:hypothetical protein
VLKKRRGRKKFILIDQGVKDRLSKRDAKYLEKVQHLGEPQPALVFTETGLGGISGGTLGVGSSKERPRLESGGNLIGGKSNNHNNHASGGGYEINKGPELIMTQKQKQQSAKQEKAILEDIKQKVEEISDKMESMINKEKILHLPEK